MNGFDTISFCFIYNKFYTAICGDGLAGSRKSVELFNDIASNGVIIIRNNSSEVFHLNRQVWQNQEQYTHGSG